MKVEIKMCNVKSLKKCISKKLMIETLNQFKIFLEIIKSYKIDNKYKLYYFQLLTQMNIFNNMIYFNKEYQKSQMMLTR